MCELLTKPVISRSSIMLLVVLLELIYFMPSFAVLDLPKIGIVSNRVANGDNIYSRSQRSFNISMIDISMQKNQLVYTIPQEVVELTVICNATYPVTWNFQESQIHSEAFYLLNIQSERTVAEIFDTNTFNYSTQIHFYAETNKITGKYVCTSTAQSSIQSSVFMFWEGISPSVLIHSQENMTVYLENNQAILPCIVSKHDIPTPQLRKEHYPTYDNIRLNKSVSYNPQIGFTLNNVPYPIGTYKCLINDNDYVLINVVVRNETAISCSTKSSNASMVYNETSNDIVCCSNSQRPPNLHVYMCNHAASCSFREHSDIIYHVMSTRRKRKSQCSTYKIAHYETGVVRCVGDGIDVYKEVIKPIRKIREPWNTNKSAPAYFSWAEIEPQNMLDVSTTAYRIRLNDLSTVNTETFYSGQQQSFICKFSTYYFSKGAQWAIKWKNSTLTLFKNNHTNTDRHHFYGPRSNTGTPLTVILDTDMDAVICFAPVWNSSVWVPKTKYLYVNESRAPYFVHEELNLEQLNWVVNDTRRIIICSATGVPTPRIKWKKDDKVLSNGTNLLITYSTNETTNTIKSVLTVLRVAYSTHGDYYCNATNFGGYVEEVFEVNITEVHSWTETVLITAAVFMAALLLFGIGLIYRKMDKDKKAIEQISSVAFKDVATRQEVTSTDFSNASVDNGKMTNNLLLD